MAIATVTNTAGDTVGISNSKTPGVWALRAALVLTTSYVASSHMPCGPNATVGFVVTCASVDYTSIQTIPQVSMDAGTTWVDVPTLRVTLPAAHSMTLANLSSATAGSYLIEIGVNTCALIARVLIKRTGGTAVGTVAVNGYGGGQA